MDEPKGGDLSPHQPQTPNYPDDPFGGAMSTETALVPAGGGRKPPPPPPPPDEEDEEDEGMLRMSFMDHLEELRSRLIRALGGLAAAFFLCVVFANELWKIVQAPADEALRKIGAANPHLVIIEPMEGFSIIWVKTPLVVSLFVASPWILYQVWSFIAPGLYKRERKWAVPFVLSTAGLFIAGGAFAYFIAFRYGLAFLLGIGGLAGVVPMVSIERYFDLFVDVMLGVALVFEMPVIIFFLTLLRLASPAWLLQHSRYAVLVIVIIAAVVTPTPDVFNLMLFAVPMCALYFVGLLAGYLLVLKRENRRFPWIVVVKILIPILVVLAGAGYLAVARFGYHLVRYWPFLTK